MKEIFDIKHSGKFYYKLDIDDKNSIPVWYIKGENKGKTLVITAGVHGCEYIGILAVREFFKEVSHEKLNGNILILPLLNEEGFYNNLKQINPFDGKNLNREFPGKKDGSYTKRLAYAIEKEIYPHADFIIDMHGGDINEEMTPLLFFPNTVDEITKKEALRVAKCLPLPYRLASSADNGLYSYAAHSKIPALLIEIGDRGEYTNKNIELAKACIYDTLASLGIKGIIKENKKQQLSEKSFYIEAAYSGFWFIKVKVGQNIKKGELLGELRSLDDKLLEEVRALEEGTVWYYTRVAGVKKGDPLIAYGIVKNNT